MCDTAFSPFWPGLAIGFVLAQLLRVRGEFRELKRQGGKP